MAHLLARTHEGALRNSGSAVPIFWIITFPEVHEKHEQTVQTRVRGYGLSYELWMGTFNDSGGPCAQTEALALHRTAPWGKEDRFDTCVPFTRTRTASRKTGRGF